jgi:aquaporin Z
MRKYLVELIGAFFLVLVIAMSVASGTALAPLAIGLSLMVMVYMGGWVSGGHYNPAVSLAVLIRGKMEARDFIPYVLAQIAGSLSAAFAAAFMTGKALTVAPGADVSIGAALLNEFLFTFALALVVLCTATAKKTSGNSYFGAAIGMTVCAGAFAGGGISGGAYNPAVGIGPIVHEAITAGKPLTHLWLYLVGPLAGGAVAAVVFRVLNSGEE